jgi:hypothetical protein
MITGAQATGIRREAGVTPSKKGRLRPFAEVPIDAKKAGGIPPGFFNQIGAL